MTGAQRVWAADQLHATGNDVLNQLLVVLRDDPDLLSGDEAVQVAELTATILDLGDVGPREHLAVVSCALATALCRLAKAGPL